jgi:hypothetical protein
VDRITTGSGPEPLERLGRGAPAFANGAGKAQEAVPGARDGAPRYGSATIGCSAAGTAMPRIR